MGIDGAYLMKKTMELFFSQYVDGGMIGLDDIPEENHPSDREITKRLKAYTQTLTTNRLTGWDSDGWTLFFKEVVEIEFDHDPKHLLCDHEETWYARPLYRPEDHDCSHMQIKKR
jgi:hypothetical protein